MSEGGKEVKKDIKRMSLVADRHAQDFTYDLNRIIIEYQELGLYVEIQYSTTLDQYGDFQYSAFVTGREVERNEKSKL